MRSILTPMLLGITASALVAQVPEPAPRREGEMPARAERAAMDRLRLKSSELIGLDIVNPKNESLGEIEEIVLDGNQHRIAYAVVGFGGFLGMGEKYFAMPWNVLRIERDAEGKEHRAILAIDKETLKAAPGFDSDKWPDMADPRWATGVDDYYRAHGNTDRVDRAGEPRPEPQPRPRTADGTDEMPKGEARAAAPISDKALAHRRLSKLIGTDVVGSDGKEIADIEDLIIDSRKATVEAAVLSFGGVLGIGEKIAVVPLDAMSFDAIEEHFTVRTTRANLEAMALPGNKLPAMHDDTWLADSRKRLGVSKDTGVADASAPKGDRTTRERNVFDDTYDSGKAEKVAGTITTIGSVRIASGEDRLRLRVRTDAGHQVTVYAAPQTHAEQRSLGLRAGKRVEIEGCPVAHGSQTVLLAGEITSDGKTVELRDSDGKPTWIK
jgi:sporulation protein YlmC with PRC-barrel domain